MTTTVAIKHKPLPYAKDALTPVISARTMDYHYDKHHAGYVKKLNDAIGGTKYEEMSLEEIILESAKSGDTGVFNNAAQTWNHDFFWTSMGPDGGGKPTGKIAEMIDATFGDYDTFREKFISAGTGQFGSGWVWLIQNGDKLEIDSTLNAHLPLEDGKKAILVCDVWEHAYYLDHQNDRKSFLEGFVDQLVNWSFANEQLS